MDVANKSVKDCLQEFFGFDSFKGEQEKIIQNLLAGNDTFVIMPTGGGKSLVYCLPAILRPGVTLVVSPLLSRWFAAETATASALVPSNA